MSSLVQNTPEWLEYRKSKIGASDAPIIMGVSQWDTCFTLWEKKLGLKYEAEMSFAMKRGHDLEEEARKSFEKYTGLIVFPQVMQHPKHEWMIASLDGIDFAHENIVEIKCPGFDDHSIALSGKVPDKYYPQLQHQLEVTGLDKAFYYSYDGSYGKLLEVKRDDSYIKLMVDKEKAFWKCLQNLEPPELSDKDYISKDDELWSMAAESWIKCNTELQYWKAREEEMRESLIALSSGNNSKGGGIKLSKFIRKGNVEYKSIPELRGVDLDKYRKRPIECWRVSKYD